MKKLITLFIAVFISVPAIFPQSLEIIGHSGNFEQIIEQYQQKANELSEKYNYFYSEFEEKYLPVLDENNKKIVGKDNFFISWLSSDTLDINILSFSNIEEKKTMHFYFRKENFDNFVPCSKHIINLRIIGLYSLWGDKSEDKTLFTFNFLDDAIETSSRALKNNPNDYEALLKRGNAYRDKGDLDKAIADYTSALKIKPNFPEALSSRGYVYYFMDQFDKAIEDYTAAIKLKPDYMEALYNRAIAYDYKGEFDKAITDYNAVLKLNPKDFETMTNRGVVYAKKGDNNRAIADFTESLKIKPDNYLALFYRGLMYLNIGNYNNAISDFEAALKLSPNDAKIKKSLEEARQKQKR